MNLIKAETLTIDDLERIYQMPSAPEPNYGFIQKRVARRNYSEPIRQVYLLPDEVKEDIGNLKQQVYKNGATHAYLVDDNQKKKHISHSKVHDLVLEEYGYKSVEEELRIINNEPAIDPVVNVVPDATTPETVANQPEQSKFRHKAGAWALTKLGVKTEAAPEKPKRKATAKQKLALTTGLGMIAFGIVGVPDPERAYFAPDTSVVTLETSNNTTIQPSPPLNLVEPQITVGTEIGDAVSGTQPNNLNNRAIDTVDDTASAIINAKILEPETPNKLIYQAIAYYNAQNNRHFVYVNGVLQEGAQSMTVEELIAFNEDMKIVDARG